MKHGFSLVELSIVLVILGLLVGGVLTGQNLIRAAELRSISTQTDTIKTSLFSFRDRYLGLPGDLRNATDFWGNADTGSAGGECSDNAADTGSGTQTCNGNGNGQIGGNTAAFFEWFRAWQHLAAAGLVEGSFTGVTGSGGAGHSVIGENVPATRINISGITLRSVGPRNSAGTLYFEGNYGNALEIGGQATTTLTHQPFLVPEEVWNIDTKLDDGLPGTGRVVVREQQSPNCATTTDPATSEYNLAFTAAACGIIMKTGL